MNMSKKKIGLLLRSYRADPYVLAVAEALAAEPDVDLRFIVDARVPAVPKFANPASMRQAEQAGEAGPAALLWRTIGRAEASMLGLVSARVRRHGAMHDLRRLRPAEDARRGSRPGDAHAGFIRHAGGDVERIRGERFDLLVAAGGLQGWATEMLGCAKDGVVALQFGDRGQDAPAAAAFWDVYSRRPSTRFVVLRATAERPQGEVLFSGRVSTQRTWLLNVEHVCRESGFYLRRILRDYVAAGTLPKAEDAGDVDPERFRDVRDHAGGAPITKRQSASVPTVGETGRYVSRTVSLYVNLAARRLLYGKRQRWSVAYVRGDWTSCALRNGVIIDNAPGRFYADPFLVEREGRVLCFVEDYSFASERGRIAAIEIGETGARLLGPVIEEDFHMSFPYVFSVDDGLYMVPETSEKREIRVYKCTGFPLRWQYHCTLMRDVPAIDPMIVHRDGKWWLLVNVAEGDSKDDHSRLFVYYAESPFSTRWTRVGDRPALFDPEKARNGGLLEAGGSLYRVSQTQGFDTYGASLRINRIERLAADGYAESEFRSVRPDFFGGIEGCHHMHSVGSYTVYDCFRSERVRNVQRARAGPRSSRVPLPME